MFILNIASSISAVFLSMLAFLVFLPLAYLGRLIRVFKKSPLKPEKVFLGISEIANLISSMFDVLSKNNILVRAELPKFNKYYKPNTEKDELKVKRKISLIIDRLARIRHLPWILLFADQVWLIWHISILKLNLDYLLFVISGVDLVIQHCGDDVRCRFLHNALFKKYTQGILIKPDAKKRKKDIFTKLLRQAFAESVAKVLSLRSQATFQKKELGHFFFYQEKLTDSPRSPAQRPIILHAPSDRNVKRTDLVLSAIKILERKELNFEFFLLENTPNKNIIEILNKTDIVIDQPSSWTGRFAIESAAASCAVVGGNQFEYLGKEASPIIQFPDNSLKLANILEDLIKNKEYRAEVMNACWYYWQENYSEEAFFDNYLSVWNNTHKKFLPLRDQKKVLLSAADGWFERIIIKLLYNPVQPRDPGGVESKEEYRG